MVVYHSHPLRCRLQHEQRSAHLESYGLNLFCFACTTTVTPVTGVVLLFCFVTAVAILPSQTFLYYNGAHPPTQWGRPAHPPRTAFRVSMAAHASYVTAVLRTWSHMASSRTLPQGVELLV